MGKSRIGSRSRAELAQPRLDERLHCWERKLVMTSIRHLDTRVVERYMKKGRITREQYAEYLASLPDLAEAAEEVDYDGLLEKEEALPILPKAAPGGGTPILTGGSAAGPLPPLPVSHHRS